MENLSFDFKTVITIVSFVITAGALYWKMQIDLAKLKIEIAEIQCDRKERWRKYDERQDKQDAIHAEILKGISSLKGDVKAIKVSIEWLKKES